MSELRKHQLVLLEMLLEIERICRKHHIQYMLFAGSLLGAVRHQGFIPWDDDLDIVMLRPEYERFLKIAPMELDRAYYLQAEFTEHWPMFFSKLRKNGTACIERYIPKDEQTHLGVYIDIFPADNLYENRFLAKLQFWASKVVIAKSLDARGYLTDSRIKKMAMALARYAPEKPLAAFVQNRNGKHSRFVHTFLGSASRYQKNIFERKHFTEMITLCFEGYDLPVSREYDQLLFVMYGDYMVPTPVEDRGYKIHAEVVDLNHSYELYTGIQKKMNFRQLTKSIR